MSSSKRKLLKKPPPVLVAIACGCWRPKHLDVYVPQPKYKQISNYRRSSNVYRSSSSSWEGGRGSGGRALYNRSSTTTTFFPDHDDEASTRYSNDSYVPTTKSYYSSPVKHLGRIGDSVAVVKESDDPYLDFQHSILEMIVAKEIYSKEDLRRLLECFLSLNPPSNHDIIVRAFTEVWSKVFPVRRTPARRSARG